jgi:preprotein translocase subunit SecB
MTRVNLAWHDPKESTTVAVEHKFDYDVYRNSGQKNLFRLVFRFALSSQTPVPVGYALESEIVGYFSFPEGTSEENMQALIRYNGCTILYGILRGQIASIAGSFPHAKLILPTVMMEDVVNQIERHKAESHKPSATTGKQSAKRTQQKPKAPARK